MSVKTVLICVSIGLFVVALWVMTIALAYSRNKEARTQKLDKPTTPAEQPLTQKTAPAKPIPTMITLQEAKQQVSLDYKWSKDGFGTIMIVDLVFTNSSPYPAKDITVTCTHYAPSGTEIDSNTRTIYEVIPAKGIKKVNDFNMGFIHSQASSTTCKIDDLEM